MDVFNGFKGWGCYSGLFLFFTTVNAGVILEDISSDGFDVKGDRYLTSGTSCNAEGMLKEYASAAFIRKFLPEKFQDKIESVSAGTVKDNRVVIKVVSPVANDLQCKIISKGSTESLDCSFVKNPLGVSSMWFRLTREKDGTRCIEKGEAKGKFNLFTLGAGKTPEQVHAIVGKTFLAEYTDSNVSRNVASARQHANGTQAGMQVRVKR